MKALGVLNQKLQNLFLREKNGIKIIRLKFIYLHHHSVFDDAIDILMMALRLNDEILQNRILSSWLFALKITKSGKRGDIYGLNTVLRNKY